MTEIIFILLYSITSDGSTVEGQVQHDFPTMEECMAERIKLIDAYRIAHPQDRPGESFAAHCEQVKL